jgi:hypothetical protein
LVGVFNNCINSFILHISFSLSYTVQIYFKNVQLLSTSLLLLFEVSDAFVNVLFIIVCFSINFSLRQASPQISTIYAVRNFSKKSQFTSEICSYLNWEGWFCRQVENIDLWCRTFHKLEKYYAYDYV